jgi:hypothetical protein
MQTGHEAKILSEEQFSNMPWRRVAVDIASASEIEDLGSNTARV